ncbi:phenylalanine--tRNA ligase subunit alpha [Candidatus Woesearchaeota archaeon]|nr:phenylalanine--tRNA ligase subunit alpha [Candidatus Woesearchaeota archaeon]
MHTQELIKCIASLHPLERKVLPHLSRYENFLNLINKTGLQEVEVMRALQWLQNKEIIETSETKKEVVKLQRNGALYREQGLPERRFLQAVTPQWKSMSDVLREAGVKEQEKDICLGILRKKSAIELKREGKDLFVKLLEPGLRFLESKSLEEQFLSASFPRALDDLKPEERFALDELRKRKEIVSVEEEKEKSITLTTLGKAILTHGLGSSDSMERVTPQILREGSWRKKEFRRYDLKAKVAHIPFGRRHLVPEASAYVKRIWLDMGFVEMEGPLVQTSFWNFDALFTAQDHPVRELQDTYFIQDPSHGKLPEESPTRTPTTGQPVHARPQLTLHVQKTHEDGWKTGSTGWQYTWNKEEAKKNVLRTHTTCLSVRTIAQLKEAELPAKFFAVGRVFRNETLDATHLFEFTQVEGIVVDPDANFRNLIGYLKEFFKKMGFTDARIRPAYFPYTEPSAEVDVYDPSKKKWIELGGAGIFRPEVVTPLLGKFVPVLAWGLGLERILVDYYKITDLREIYKNDLKQLRELRAWTK